MLKKVLLLPVYVTISSMLALPVGAQQTGQAAKPDSEEVKADIAKAKEIAGTTWAMEEHFFCEAPQTGRVPDPGPQKLFDNLYAIPGSYGAANGVVYAITTSKGIILIDAGAQRDVDTVLLPGMKTLALDPANVKLVVVTHGHADHFGGSAYFQDHYGSHVALSAADWDFMLNPPAGGPASANPPPAPPKRDVVAVEGKPLVLGNEKITPVLIPGHTPGSMGLIFPVKEGKKTHVVAIMGGGMLGANGSPAQMQQFLHSIDHFKEWTTKMKVDVELQNHPLMDGFSDKLTAIRARKTDEPNPFIVGRENYTKFLDVMSLCFQAAVARRAE